LIEEEKKKKKLKNVRGGLLLKKVLRVWRGYLGPQCMAYSSAMNLQWCGSWS
jgi:hypothetical protein